MRDAGAAYEPGAIGYLLREKHAARDVQATRREAISYAAYRLLKYRFPVGFFDRNGITCHPNAAVSQAAFDAQMAALGYDTQFTSTEGAPPGAGGKRIAAAVIRYGQPQGANEGVGRRHRHATGDA